MLGGYWDISWPIDRPRLVLVPAAHRDLRLGCARRHFIRLFDLHDHPGPDDAYNLGNLLRRLALPIAIQSWSLTSLQQRLFKTRWRLIRHARYFILQLAESHLTRRLFGQILGRIERLAWHPT
jgi:Transposase DDE domain group 1